MTILVPTAHTRFAGATLTALWGLFCPYRSGGGWAGPLGHLRRAPGRGACRFSGGFSGPISPSFHGTFRPFSGAQNSKVPFNPKSLVFPSGPGPFGLPKMSFLVFMPGGRFRPPPNFPVLGVEPKRLFLGGKSTSSLCKFKVSHLSGNSVSQDFYSCES